ncbi:hypothetical protein [Lysinibacillus telephonicus]|nr:hypothetical protein [Lysinibacillus telephonicus]
MDRETDEMSVFLSFVIIVIQITILHMNFSIILNITKLSMEV